MVAAQEDCGFLGAGCAINDWVGSAVGDAIDNMANAVMEGVANTIASLGTMWVHIGTPNLTGSGGGSVVDAGEVPPDAGNVTEVLGYVMWISLAVAIIALFALGALISSRMRAGEGVAAVGRVGMVLLGVVLIAAASALVAGVMPAGPRNAGGAALFLQSTLWWYTGALAVVSVIIGGARMAVQQRAEPGTETVKSILTLVVVAGAGLTVIGLLVAAADSFSVWVINRSLECDVTSDAACFEQSLSGLLNLSPSGEAAALGALLIIILGLIAILASFVQILLMVARGGLLVILAGILPLAASFTNTEMGKGWFKKCIGWLLAFILYKPAAAIVYAAAFQLMGTNIFTDDGTGLLSVITGLTLMMLALVALPALMRFVTPMMGAMAGGAAGGAAAAAGMALLPTGAAAAGRLASGSGAGSSGGQAASGPSRTSAATSSPSGSDGTGGANGSGGSAGAGGSPGSGGTSGGQGPAGSSPDPGGQSDALKAGASKAGAAAGLGGTTGPAGSGASGAASGAGVAGVAAQAAVKAGQTASDTAKAIGEESTGTGEGGGPDGSR